MNNSFIRLALNVVDQSKWSLYLISNIYRSLRVYIQTQISIPSEWELLNKQQQFISLRQKNYVTSAKMKKPYCYGKYNYFLFLTSRWECFIF